MSTYTHQLREISAYTDEELENQLKLSDTVTSQDLNAMDRALKATMVGYLVSLAVLLLNAFLWKSPLVSLGLMFFFIGAFIWVHVLDRRSDRSLKRFGYLVNEQRVRIAYKIGYEEGILSTKKKTAKKTVAKKAPKK